MFPIQTGSMAFLLSSHLSYRFTLRDTFLEGFCNYVMWCFSVFDKVANLEICSHTLSVTLRKSTNCKVADVGAESMVLRLEVSFIFGVVIRG